jgi:4'-phosphopantetheinyl transferase
LSGTFSTRRTKTTTTTSDGGGVAFVPERPAARETLAVALTLGRDGRHHPASLAFSFGSGYGAAQEAAVSFLHPREFGRWSGLKFPIRRRSYLLGRRAAKAALAVCFPNFSPTSIEVASGVFGQPYMGAGSPVTAEISLAHAHDAAVALVCPAGHPAGVDLEVIDPARASVARSSCTPSELNVVQRLGLPEAASSFLLWSVREALGKALRCGLAVPFENLAVDSVEGREGHYESLFAHFPPFRAHSWVLGDHVLSIVLPKKTTLDFEPPPELASLMRSPPATSG